MDVSKDIYQRITKKHGTVLDLKSNPGILQDILNEVRSSPFNVPWMDSWAANWLMGAQAPTGKSQQEFNKVLGQMVDQKFRERLSELKRFLGAQGVHSPTPPPDDFKAPPDYFRVPPPPDPTDPDAAFFSSPPPPDPGFFSSSPPPDPNDFKSPTPPPDDFKSPPPPDPNDFRQFSPPPPDPGALKDNPWILYWFVSINAPLILDMIDAHISTRINDIKMQTQKR